MENCVGYSSWIINLHTENQILRQNFRAKTNSKDNIIYIFGVDKTSYQCHISKVIASPPTAAVARRITQLDSFLDTLLINYTQEPSL